MATELSTQQKEQVLSAAQKVVRVYDDSLRRAKAKQVAGGPGHGVVTEDDVRVWEWYVASINAALEESGAAHLTELADMLDRFHQELWHQNHTQQ